MNLKKYNILHHIDNNRFYRPIHHGKTENAEPDIGLNKQELASFIKNNYNKLSYEEKKSLVLKCLDEKEINAILLRYEYYNDEDLKPVKYMPLNDALSAILKIINRYQSKAGGYVVEDVDWTVIRHTDDSEKVKDNQILLQNTVTINEKDDGELSEYLKELEYKLGKIAENITIDIRGITMEKEKIEYLHIWIIDEKCECENCKRKS